MFVPSRQVERRGGKKRRSPLFPHFCSWGKENGNGEDPGRKKEKEDKAWGQAILPIQSGSGEGKKEGGEGQTLRCFRAPEEKGRE